MLSVSDNFKTAASQNIKQVSAQVIINPFEGEQIVITGDDDLISFTIESTGELFGSVSAIATIKVKGSNWDVIGKTVSLSVGVLVDNVFEWLSYGYFTIAEAPITKGSETTVFKALSKMAIMQNEDYKAGIIYPTTVAGLAGAIAERFELSTDDLSDLPNSDYEIQEDLYANISGTNYRNILAEIAGTTATMAMVDNVAQKIVFRPPQAELQGELNYDTLKTLSINAHYGPVNSVVLSRSPQEDNIAVTDSESVATYGLTEVKLANNEIMDDERTVFIENILNAVRGIEWTGFEATTIGLGWYECGDRLSITDANGNVIEGIITYHSITVDGGIKEIIRGVPPITTTTDYALAGGVMKTIYNTEILVDRQNQQIQSIVEEQRTFANQTEANFTNITQNISSVVTSVQNSGGNNLIKNSAMYAKSTDGDRLPLHWTMSGTGTWDTTPSADASANGSLSGQVISLAGETAQQVITVKPDDDSIIEENKTYYSFSCRIKKTAVGECSVTLTDGTQEGVWTLGLGNNETADYTEFAIEGILPHSTELTLSVNASNDAEFYITDMMLAVGELRSQWTQANGEFSNSQVQIDIDGVTVKNNNLDGTYTRQTSQSVEAYEEGRLSSVISPEKVEAPVGMFGKEIDMPPIKIVPQNDGWAFVKKEN